MARRSSELTILGDDSYDGDVKLPTPIRLTEKDLEAITVEVAGFKFLSIGSQLVCPQCGRVSGTKGQVDPDEQLNFFLWLGCKHYKKDKPKTGEQQIEG